MENKTRKKSELSLGERYEIYALLKAGKTQAQIARQLKRARSTISREVKRGTVRQIEYPTANLIYTYKPAAAEKRYRKELSKRGRQIKLGKDYALAELIEYYIKECHYSPYATLAKIRSMGKMTTSICVTTLYSYIHKGVLDIEERHLLFGFNKRKKDEPFEERRDAKGANGGKSISERPLEVLWREEFGHWEGDLIQSKKGCLESVLTLVERKSRFLVAVKVPSRKQVDIVNAFDELEERLGERFYKWFKTITFDNGVEFRDVKSIQRSFRIGLNDPGGNVKRIEQIYFAHPFCSGERGTNENTNRMIRRRFSKGISFAEVDKSELEEHVRWINEYPRKIFNGKSAQEKFNEEIAKI